MKRNKGSVKKEEIKGRERREEQKGGQKTKENTDFLVYLFLSGQRESDHR